jgi:predicted N-acetyltransferase YhbS
VPSEVGIFSALWEAEDMIDELSFTAPAQNAIVGHVTASRAKVGFDSVVAVGPIGVLVALSVIPQLRPTPTR